MKKKKMGRPRKFKEPCITLSFRVEESVLDGLEDVARSEGSLSLMSDVARRAINLGIKQMKEKPCATAKRSRR